MLRAILRNPITMYFRFVLEYVLNQGRYRDFCQGYMARVIRCKIQPRVSVHEHSHLVDSAIGSYSYIATNTRMNLTEVGKFCSIGPGCRIGLGVHPSRSFVSTSPVFFSTDRQCGSTFVESSKFPESSPISIGNDVWIGANVIVADGVTIGNGAIVGAGAVVVSNVPAYAIYGGVPAQLIRFRFSHEQIAWLEGFAWWNRDDQWLRAHANLFTDIAAFMAEAGSHDPQNS